MASDRPLSRSSFRVLAGAVLATTLLVVAPPLAHADPTAADRETARGLMDDADHKAAQKDYQGALKSYQAAHAIMGVPTTGIEVAKAQEQLGLLVEARDAYGEVTRYPVKPGEPEAYTRARSEANARALRISPRIPSFHLNVMGPPGGIVLDVKVDGEVVPAAAATLPRRVNPGRHTVTVSASGWRESSSEISLREGETRELKFALVPGPVVVAAPPPPPPVGMAPPPAYYGPPPGYPGGAGYYPTPVEMKRRSTGLFVGGIIATSVGGVALIAGVLVGLVGSATSSVDSGFGGSGNSGSDTSTTGYGVAVGGGVLLAGGVTMLILGNRKVPANEPAQGALLIEPILSPRETGIRLRF